jgi:hypothetical protein
MDFRDLRQLVVGAEALFIDKRNRKIYGEHAPKVAELIWINPLQVTHYINSMPRQLTSNNRSAVVLDFKKSNIQVVPLLERPQVQSCVQHWRYGTPWEETIDYRTLLADLKRKGKVAGCRTKEDIRKRFNRLDQIFESVARTRELKTQKQLKRWNFREFGGIQISINENGKPVLTKAGGLHRLAMAHILELDVIPASIGLVDKGAIEILPQFRNRPSAYRTQAQHDYIPGDDLDARSTV